MAVSREGILPDSRYTITDYDARDSIFIAMPRFIIHVISRRSARATDGERVIG